MVYSSSGIPRYDVLAHTDVCLPDLKKCSRLPVLVTYSIALGILYIGSMSFYMYDIFHVSPEKHHKNILTEKKRQCLKQIHMSILSRKLYYNDYHKKNSSKDWALE